MQHFAEECLTTAGANMRNVEFFHHPTNDAWCRDHGPAFLVNPGAKQKKIIVDWNYNAWGGKYPPYDLDDVIPTLIGKALDIPVYHPGIIMVLAYLLLLPPLLAKTVLRSFFVKMGFVRFFLLVNLIQFMAALPIKMVLRWTMNLKYVVAIPELFFNI